MPDLAENRHVILPVESLQPAPQIASINRACLLQARCRNLGRPYSRRPPNPTSGWRAWSNIGTTAVSFISRLAQSLIWINRASSAAIPETPWLKSSQARSWLPMVTSASGQKRRFDPLPAISGLPRATDIARTAQLARFVSNADIASLFGGTEFG
jgi:hypothetical protein